jgi:intracellular sulfur oxidation DsrE/DsrF family protein
MRLTAIPTLTALLLAASAALLPASSHAQASAQKSERYKLVIQVSENNPALWNLALNNAENVQEALGKDAGDIEIVAYGPGLNMLKDDSKVAPRLNAALDHSVSLLACGTTMRKMKITKGDLAAGVNVVPAGVVEIMKRQKEGWSYIRP